MQLNIDSNDTRDACNLATEIGEDPVGSNVATTVPILFMYINPVPEQHPIIAGEIERAKIGEIH